MLIIKRSVSIIVILVSLITSNWCFSQPKTVTLEVTTKLTSQLLSLSITLPRDYEKNNQQHYPVLYTTASDRRLSVIKEQVDWMSHVSFGPIVPMIIVQLPYIKLPNEIQNKDVQASGLNTQLTIDILQKSILPLIETNFRVQPFKILEGYSTNANLPLNILAQAPALFNAYISINPAWVLDKNQLLEKLGKQLSNENLVTRTLYVSLGEFSQNNDDFTTFKQLILNSDSDLRVTVDDQRHINYYTAPMVLFPKALETLFSDMHPKNLTRFIEGGIKSVNQYYKKLALKYGYPISPVNTLFDLSNHYSETNNPEKNIAVLRYILTLQPDNIFYHIMLSNSLFTNKQFKAYKLIIEKAKALAEKSHNQEALEHINHLIIQNDS